MKSQFPKNKFDYVDLFKKLQMVKKSEGLSCEEMSQLQQLRLQNLLKHTLTNSSFYSNYYKNHGITLDNINKVSSKDLPTVNKDILMNNFDSIVTDKRIKRQDLDNYLVNPDTGGKEYLDTYHVFSTSGSTSRQGIFVYSKDEWHILKAVIINRISKTKISAMRKIKIASIIAHGPKYAASILLKELPSLFFDIFTISVNQPLDGVDL